LFGPGEIGEVASFVSVALYVLGDESKWQPFPDFTEGHDYVVVWLQILTGQAYIPGMEYFLSLEKAGVVAVRREAQVIRRFDIVVANVMLQEQEKGHASVSFGSVGLHWVTTRGTFAVPYDFVFRSNYPAEGAEIILFATVAGD
jgi:hypothetical protein